MNKLKKLTISIVGIAIISTIGVSSSDALEISNPLAKVFEQWQEQLSSLDKYIDSVVSGKLGNLSESLQGDLQVAVNESVGTLGLPSATEVREKVEEIAANDDNAVNSVDKVTNEIDRQITRASADTTLSKQGQQITKQQVEKTQTSIEQVKANANAAQAEVVTQNVMKRIAQQNTQMAAILGVMRTDGLKLKQSQDLANLNLTNISRSLDGQNQVHQKETVGQGFNNLRTASQARLF
ncbi:MULTISPECIES: hypothetical protein [unclassified Tolypothrix]|uniref:hypothetical protein n=1 Tax=unclassified Tolypothrix TaxID=2649714 RepID=UPI0005EAA90D|nr:MULTISPECIES: hypothetical protein [unclassified Tolypothrix]BAY93644.1 hypothetical protein NIES3275_56860 [Microchaete diplosiphon NIES-3275]EKE99556.1 hypothetical protein FDUTEX481_09816 [Tolypothrix sp. PCC 7601]MBE9081697.1 hypothetical protein [Tolypothrix sp. LEGE 11397]UYD27464.1 hypothetical protein HGR01_05085 [Tolypothrix sp. PCC 7712]UYD36672.1 hypothetical protein HG267_13625 [Tolypothrix sp. PCC 7601]